jgi:CRISPR-associated protein Csm2
MAIKFWQDQERTQLDPKLFSDIAENEAKKVYQSAEPQGKDVKKNKPTQLRRFFDEIVAFEARYNQALSKEPKESEKVFKQHLPFIHMLIPKVKYAHARNLVSKDFVDLVKSTIIDNLRKPEDLKILKSFFEAFMGHYKYCLTVEGQARQQNYHGRSGGRR